MPAKPAESSSHHQHACWWSRLGGWAVAPAWSLGIVSSPASSEYLLQVRAAHQGMGQEGCAEFPDKGIIGFLTCHEIAWARFAC